MDAVSETKETRTATVFNTSSISGGVVKNVHGHCIHGDYIGRQIIHLTVKSAAERSEVLEHLREAYSVPSSNVGPPAAYGPSILSDVSASGTTGPSIDASHTCCTRSIIEIHLMIDIVRMMTANPALYSSANLPETLSSLQRLLHLTKLAVQAYRHTPLADCLGRAIGKGLDDCRQLLWELLSYLSTHRRSLSTYLLQLIRRYVCLRSGEGGVIAVFDSRLRECHRAFAACLLALGSAAWPELERGSGQEILASLAEFYHLLEQESASLRHIPVDAVTVVNHLGCEMPVPLVFCRSWSDFHVVVTGFCKHTPGHLLVQQGDYRILRADDGVIYPADISTSLHPGMKVEMSIVLHEQVPCWHPGEIRKCPRCQHVNGENTTESGWSSWCVVDYHYKPDLKQRLVAPQDVHYFRRISVFQEVDRMARLFSGNASIGAMPLAVPFDDLFKSAIDVDFERDFGRWFQPPHTDSPPPVSPSLKRSREDMEDVVSRGAHSQKKPKKY
ncbi:hypothetical protein HWV62_19625 [Athelia sp. TMB]|nr:hypothetical protein HWV62_19625 [Athelia sp. TMB]